MFIYVCNITSAGKIKRKKTKENVSILIFLFKKNYSPSIHYLPKLPKDSCFCKKKKQKERECQYSLFIKKTIPIPFNILLLEVMPKGSYSYKKKKKNVNNILIKFFIKKNQKSKLPLHQSIPISKPHFDCFGDLI